MASVSLGGHGTAGTALWLACLALCGVLAALRQWLPASFLAIAALYAGLTGMAMAPPHSPDLAAGAQVTVRGELASASPTGEKPNLLRVQSALTATGWQPAWGTVGLYPPDDCRAGDLLEASGVLRQPTPQVNPGGFSARLYWLRRGAGVVLHPHADGIHRIGLHPPDPWRFRLHAIRTRLLEVNRRTLSPATALIVNDFLVGDTGNPDRELSTEVDALFRDSGTVHLLVVSGTQVMLVLGAFIWIGWRFYRLRFFWWGLGFLALGAFYFLTDGGISVARAAVMGGAIVLGLALDREPDGLNCLGLAALVLLLFQPLALYDVGGQLSFAALWALMTLGEPLERALGPGPTANPGHPGTRAHSSLAKLVAGTVAAHLGTAPLLAFHWQRSAWSGIPANLVVLLFVSLITPVALAHTLLAACGINVLHGAMEYCMRALVGWVRFFAHPPFGAGDVFPPPLWLLLLLLLGLAVPALSRRHRALPLAWATVLALVLFVSERSPAAPPSAATLRAIDVGQGDAVLLQGPDGSNVLVDAGPTPRRPDSSPLVEALRALRVPELDAVVVSHLHADHIGGLPPVLRSIPVRLLVEDTHVGDWDEWSRVRSAAEQRRIPVVHPAAGDRVQIRGSTLTVLGPLRAPGARPPQDPNDESLLLRWDCAGAQMLLTGDTGERTEGDLLRWGSRLQAQVLKVGHHGSRKASTSAWLQAVHPTVAVISCGRDNRFGHPAPETLARLQAAGVRVERTDQDGMVTVTASPAGVKVERFVEPN